MDTTNSISPLRTFATAQAAAAPVLAPDPVQSSPVVLEEPRAGGNYLRDPVTGALTLNPAHPVTPTEE